jgi:hypothetical protein
MANSAIDVLVVGEGRCDPGNVLGVGDHVDPDELSDAIPQGQQSRSADLRTVATPTVNLWAPRSRRCVRAGQCVS